MNIRVVWRNGDVDSIETTAVSSVGVADDGPGACALWRDRLIVHDWRSSGIVLERSFCGWSDPAELSMARDSGSGASDDYCDYQIVTAERLLHDVSEVWVDGVGLLLLDEEGKIRPADEVARERGQGWR